MDNHKQPAEIACEHYEAALKAAFPQGAHGVIFEEWNKARNYAMTDQEIDKNHLGFHYKDGWWFARRGANGDVLLYKQGPQEPARLILTIDEASWASIICSVSAAGENSERYITARALHMGEMP